VTLQPILLLTQTATGSNKEVWDWGAGKEFRGKYQFKKDQGGTAVAMTALKPISKCFMRQLTFNNKTCLVCYWKITG